MAGSLLVQVLVYVQKIQFQPVLHVKRVDDRILHNVSTLRLYLDERVLECLSLLNDEKLLLLAKLSGGDLIALESKYHTHCLSTL